jgi:tetratricopeptide (TPR) repeat protein
MHITLRRVGCIILLFLAKLSFAQVQKIDSLETLLNNSSDETRCDIEYELGITSLNLNADINQTTDYHVALKYGTESLKLAEQLGDSIRFLKASILKATAYKSLENLDSAINIYLKVLPLAEKLNQTVQMAYIYNDLGLIYTFQALYDKALSYHFKSLEVRRRREDKAAISMALTNMGLVYYKLKNYDKAILYYNEALQLKKEIKDIFYKDRLLIDLSLCYALKSDFTKAKKYIAEAFAQCNVKCADPILIEGEFCQGIIYFGLQKDTTAEKHFLESYALAKKINDIRFQLENMVYLAQIYIARNNAKLAAWYLKDAELIASHTEYNLLLMEINKQFYVLYGKLNDYEKESLYQSKYIQLRDSIYGEELTQHLMAVHAENEERENQSKIASQDKVLQLKEEVITRQTILNFLAISIAVLLIALIFTLYKNNRQKKRNNILLEQKVEDRTFELLESYELMKRTYKEQDEIIQKASVDMKSPLNTLKSLCDLAAKEVEDEESHVYVKNITSIVEQIEEKVNSLLQKDDMDHKGGGA